ncbi:glycosyltransferase family 4 protein [Maritimibacter alkaliphilus]|uniref:glycosyltransferase family 4 protein n=1 Tax=Maritimibacter alkaliphilus TaxID=404236 RepID=UPI001C9759D3|nr:glycosyltransferase family 4 protein [Maritimibacter alkaliphilus]MBY6089569.1 glycosyltransferase family 4 protein [Maritimibacter alkaliphilus]
MPDTTLTDDAERAPQAAPPTGSPGARPRIVILNDSSVAKGGATGLAVWSAKLLDAAGCDVTYLAGDDGKAPSLEGTGVTCIGLGGARLMEAGRLTALTKGLHNAPAQRALADYIAKTDTPDTVYHLHGWAQIFSPAVFGALRPVAPRVVIHAHDYFLACPNGAHYDYRNMRNCDRIQLSGSCLLANCDKRNAVQKGWRVLRQVNLMRLLDKTAPWGAIALIHPGLREVMEQAGYPSEMLRVVRNPAAPLTPERIRVEENDQIVFIGRLTEEKGVPELAQVCDAHDLPLTLIGDGPLREKIAARYPQFTMPGWVAHDQIGQHLTRARMLVMPSRAPEPFGLVAAEASASGLPVVIPDLALLAGEIDRRGLGLTYHRTDGSMLAAALKKLSTMPAEEIREMSLRCTDPENAIAMTPEAWTQALLDLYGDLLARA